ncbi:TIGR01777 family oxidoreductase [Streptomyces triculaminicus]|uniref:TIGR01777 family oxidoreductase n=2 Tax=Streptomyces TaxID=1883 RepID=A0A939FV78_9ACTN|nr:MULTISPECIES: TIGR01777 family oxidoreductase [Streptomyces]MBO0656680.1 TIGR01777 family oxidoreductase [Streptomyces triculaminicus]QSY47874.1 TIGR01777 family oxidoreductase [Streptomyces griseocarneus]
MRVAVTGSTGLIGRALTRALVRDGDEVVRLVRHPPRQPGEVEWDPARQRVDAAGLAGCEAVVHLAGAGVGDHRWTAAYKKEIRDSRVLGTGAIAEAVASLDTPPRVLLSASAIGVYGDTGERVVDENTPPGRGFLADVCQEWEAATGAATEAGVRTVLLRTGLVVSADGGAWARLFPLAKLGLAGRLGNGRQYWSFISLADHVAALRHLLRSSDLSGPFNLTAPHPVTNREATEATGRVLRRPALLPAPAPALRLALGEMATEVLASQRVLPRRLLESGFVFAHPDIESAVRAALAKS